MEKLPEIRKKSMPVCVFPTGKIQEPLPVLALFKAETGL